MKFLGSKGLSLLEVLLALGIFSFMFVVITQIVEQNYRQGKKMQTDIRQNSRFDNVRDLLKTDLASVSFFLDVNANFRRYFPLGEEETLISDRDKQDLRDKNSLPVFFDSDFLFLGTQKELEFVSYSFSEGSEDKQWLHIRYQVEDCPERSGAYCLIRSSREFFGESSQNIPENQLIVLRAFQSLEWSYSSDYKLEWKQEWKSGSGSGLPQALSFPSYVQIRIQSEDQEDISWIFLVSQSHLIAWSPYAKKWTHWPKVEDKIKPKPASGATSGVGARTTDGARIAPTPDNRNPRIPPKTPIGDRPTRDSGKPKTRAEQ